MAATEADMAELEQHLEILEGLLRDAEDVSAVLEFAPPEGTSAGKASHFGASATGAAELAREIEESVARWRGEQEDAFVERSRDHAMRLKKVLLSRQRVEADRAKVREAIRNNLFAQAEESLKRQIGTMNTRNLDTVQPASDLPGGEVLGHGSHALAALEKRLDVALAPLEAMRPTPPKEMVLVKEMLATTLERKQMRGEVQHASLPAVARAYDSELLEEAEQCYEARRRSIQAQADCQASALQRLKECMETRKKAFQELEMHHRNGPPPLPEEIWRALGPTAMGEGQRTMALPPRSVPENPDEALEEAEREVLRIGGEHVEKLCEDFRHAYLHRRGRHQMRHNGVAEGALEVWKLQTAKELLMELREAASLSYKDIVDSFRKRVEDASASPLKQLSAAIASAEEFNKARMMQHADVCAAAEARLRAICEQDQQMFQAWRRRTELCTLKRWNASPEGIEDVRYEPRALDLINLAEMTQQLLGKCHAPMPMEQEEKFKPQRNNCEKVDRRRRMVGGDAKERLEWADKTLSNMPDSVETCAAAKAALSLLDDELTRVIGKLRASLPMSSSHRASIDSAAY